MSLTESRLNFAEMDLPHRSEKLQTNAILHLAHLMMKFDDESLSLHCAEFDKLGR
jgi:hypothetical protein